MLTPFRTLTSIGAWVIILSAAIEPFFQQIISFEDAVSYHDNNNVKISYATTFDAGTEAGTFPPDAYSSSDGNNLVLHVPDYGWVTDLNLDFQVQASVLFGLSTDLTHAEQTLKTTCPSGNCTWPPYLTLGVWSACNDVTDQVSRSQSQDYPQAFFFPNTGAPQLGSGPANLTTYSLPNGLSLNNRDPNQDYLDQSDPLVMSARSNLSPSQTVSFKNETTMLWSTAVLRVPNASDASNGMWTDPTALNVDATECGLFLCLKQYTSRLQNGELIEDSSTISTTRDTNSWQVQFDPEGGTPSSYIYSDGVSPAVDALYTNITWLPRTDLSISVPPHAANNTNNVTRVNASQPGIDTLSHYLSSIFNDGVLTDASLGSAPEGLTFNCTLNKTVIPCGRLNNVTGMVLQQASQTGQLVPTFYPPVMEVLWDNTNLGDMFAVLAESLTIAMRRLASGAPTVSGKLGTLQTLLRVRWAWITLPVVCLVISAVFLLMSILEAKSDATPLWKSGGLAYLAHGLDQQTREKVQRADLSSEMEEASEGIKVRLHRGEDGVLMLRGEGAEMQKTGDESEEHDHDHEDEREPLSAGPRV